MTVTEKAMTPYVVQHQRAHIDEVLESAVVLSWQELQKGLRPRHIQVEYGTAPEPCLQYVKMWRSPTRGIWDLICEYWISPGMAGKPAMGLTFSNGYYSAALAEMLREMMLHRDGLANSLAGDSGVSLIMVHAPTEDERRKAKDCMNDAYHRIGLAYPEAPRNAA
jgi:hypothetical protein